MRKIQFAEGEFYHLYNRGVDKRVVFAGKQDFDRFQAYLYLLNDVHSGRASNFFFADRKSDVYDTKRSEPLVAVGAYCLLPNHFHLLVTPLSDNGVAKFMQKVLTAYTMYFNEKMSRSGSLFQGTYKSEHAASDTDLKYLYSYIHLNPAKLLTTDWQDASAEELRQLGPKILAYPYSSAGEYRHNKYFITNPKPFPKYFQSSKDINAHLQFWLTYKKKKERD